MGACLACKRRDPQAAAYADVEKGSGTDKKDDSKKDKGSGTDKKDDSKKQGEEKEDWHRLAEDVEKAVGVNLLYIATAAAVDETFRALPGLKYVYRVICDVSEACLVHTKSVLDTQTLGSHSNVNAKHFQSHTGLQVHLLKNGHLTCHVTWRLQKRLSLSKRKTTAQNMEETKTYQNLCGLALFGIKVASSQL